MYYYIEKMIQNRIPVKKRQGRPQTSRTHRNSNLLDMMKYTNGVSDSQESHPEQFKPFLNEFTYNRKQSKTRMS